MSDSADLLVGRIRDVLAECQLELFKTANSQKNLGKTPTRLLAEGLLADPSPEIWLVEVAEIDRLENHFSDALQYVKLGYVFGESPRPNSQIAGTGWPVQQGDSVPRYRYTLLRRVAKTELRGEET